MTTFSKSTLQQMNSSVTLGFNWIKNIENIGDNMEAKLYSTGNAGLGCGRMYIALPASLVITNEIVKKYNLWL